MLFRSLLAELVAGLEGKAVDEAALKRAIAIADMLKGEASPGAQMEIPNVPGLSR